MIHFTRFRQYAYVYLVALAIAQSCNSKSTALKEEHPYIVVLGTVQDGGYPQLGCTKKCCAATANGNFQKYVTSLGLYDPLTEKKWLFEATPDLRPQWQLFSQYTNKKSDSLHGIFLTHAHMGHYTGLMYLGFESLNTKKIPVYCMPRMKQYLTTNGPWNQLVKLQNILIRELADSTPVSLVPGLRVMPFRVPHREEYSEVVGYQINGPNRSAVFIPDIDKWELWSASLPQAIEHNDYIFIDATFFDATELSGRDMSKVPHPFVIETMKLLSTLPLALKQRVYFIHLNHTNPALKEGSDVEKIILTNGFNIAHEGQKFEL
jgi:pyrroloquinoline quinone biosynthesis protein B